MYIYCTIAVDITYRHTITYYYIFVLFLSSFIVVLCVCIKMAPISVTVPSRPFSVLVSISGDSRTYNSKKCRAYVRCKGFLQMDPQIIPIGSV